MTLYGPLSNYPLSRLSVSTAAETIVGVASSSNALTYSTNGGQSWTLGQTVTNGGLIEVIKFGTGVGWLDLGVGSSTTANFKFTSDTTPTTGSSYTTESFTITALPVTNIIRPHLVQRSNGEIVTFHQGNFRTMGTDYANVYYQRRTGTNTWASPVSISGNLTVGCHPYGIAVSGDRVHFLWSRSDTQNLWVSTLSSSNTLTHVELSGWAQSRANAGMGLHGSTLHVWLLGTSSGVYRREATSADTPSFGSATSTLTTNISTAWSSAYDPTNQITKTSWIGASSSCRVGTRTNSGWTTATPYTSTTGGTVHAAPVIYTKSNGAICYGAGISLSATDSGSSAGWFWDETQLSAGAESYSGSVSLSGSGTITFPTRTPSLSQSTALSGAGTLTLTGTPGPISSVALSGEGTLTGVAPQVESGTVDLSGTGVLETTAATLLLPPANLTVTVVSPTELDVSWDAATGATGYDLERNGVIISEYQPGTTYSDTGLTEGTSYTYRVRSQKVES